MLNIEVGGTERWRWRESNPRPSASL